MCLVIDFTFQRLFQIAVSFARRSPRFSSSSKVASSTSLPLTSKVDHARSRSSKSASVQLRKPLKLFSTSIEKLLRENSPRNWLKRLNVKPSELKKFYTKLTEKIRTNWNNWTCLTCEASMINFDILVAFWQIKIVRVEWIETSHYHPLVQFLIRRSLFQKCLLVSSVVWGS